MTSIPIRQVAPAVQVPIVHCDALAADTAFKEHAALARAMRDAPTLANRPEFTMLRADVYVDFDAAFQVSK